MSKFIILFGGSSYEHEISILSAITLKKSLINLKLEFVFIDENSDFYLLKKRNLKSSFFLKKKYLNARKIFIMKNYFYSKNFLGLTKIYEGTVLNLVHGRDGEDGKIASLLEFYKFNYISPNTEASVISYNKIYTKQYADNLNINILPFTTLNINQDREHLKNLLEYPVIIKPARLGSSIGISIVKNEKELNYSLDTAFEFDDEVIIEAFIPNIVEYNLAGCKSEDWNLSIIEEPQKKEFLDFNTKYLDFGRSDKVTEANINNKLKIEIQENFKKIYGTLFKGSIIRCDFFIKDNKVYLNEINSIPGSMAHYLFENFENILIEMSKNISNEKSIKINYEYINKLKNNKI